MTDDNETFISSNILPESADWDEALGKLQGHGRCGLGYISTDQYDATPLAKLLRNGRNVPLHVIQKLGFLLDPPSDYIGGRLIYKEAGQVAKKLFTKNNRDFKALNLRNELVKSGVLFEEAIQIVADEFRLSVSWAKNLKTDFDALVDDTNKKLDPKTGLP